MTYSWTPRELGNVFALPGSVVDEHLRLAGSAQLKILLWFARQGGRFDLSACAAAVGISPADCLDALQFWVERGVLSAVEDGAPVTPAVGTGPAPIPEPSRPTSPMAATEPTTRPAAVKPSVREVIDRQESCPDFAALVDTLSARLGRPLAHNDTATLLYLYDTAGLPAEVIVMVAVYAVTNGKGNMRYIEKMALDWADREIITVDAAERELCRLEQRRRATEQIQTAFSIPGNATYSQSDAAYRWLVDWELSMELIALAGKQCIERTGKFQYSYVNKVLESWRAKGLTTPELVEHPPEPPKKAKKQHQPDRPTSFDVAAYDEMALRYIPVYSSDK